MDPLRSSTCHQGAKAVKTTSELTQSFASELPWSKGYNIEIKGLYKERALYRDIGVV